MHGRLLFRQLHVLLHSRWHRLSQLQGLEDSNILLEHNDVWSCQPPNHNRTETGGVGGFPRPFSKSLLRNVLVEYAVLVSQLLVEYSPPQLLGWSTNTTETRSLWCILYNTNFSRGGNFRYIREFGFCAKCSSREIFLPQIFLSAKIKF